MNTAEDLQELADREAIRSLLFSYCRSVDRLDLPLGHSVFHEDSYADYGEGVYQGPGRGAIDKICRDHLHLLNHSHQVSNILISLFGDRAGSEAYVTGTMVLERDGKQMQIFVRARYLDAWEKRDGRWGIVRREVGYDHDEIREITPVRGMSNTARDETDRSYAYLRGEV